MISFQLFRFGLVLIEEDLTNVSINPSFAKDNKSYYVLAAFSKSLDKSESCHAEWSEASLSLCKRPFSRGKTLPQGDINNIVRYL